MKPILKLNFVFVYIFVIALCLPSILFAKGNIVWEELNQLSLEEKSIDTAISYENRMIFILTKKKIHFYSMDKKSIIESIETDQKYNTITSAENGILILTSNNPASMKIKQFSIVYDIDISNRPFRGAENAPVTLVVFDDYQCRYCSRLEGLIDKMLEKHPKNLKIVIKHFPLPKHKMAFDAAMAALAANKQGKFWEFHSELLKNFNSVTEEKIKSTAQNLKLNMDAFEADRKSPEHKAIIEQDMEHGKTSSVSGTPAVFINGKRIKNRELGNLQNFIEKELKQKEQNQK
ncbi:MAG: thioredoxin domain-containing protein [Desulfobacteraceae bacterium]|nr:thioredoxin domain-containing protein [Desulfobacteraceae bacterium]